MSSTPIMDQLIAEGVIPKHGKPPIMREKKPQKFIRARRTKKQMEEARKRGH